MITDIKRVDQLTVADLVAHPVWQFTNREGADETFVRPVKRVPVSDLAGKVIGVQVTLAGGRRAWALVGNVNLKNVELTRHCITFSIERDGQWFMLARYHDFDYASKGPEALSRFLGLQTDEVFPIAYDIQAYSLGEAAVLSGLILKDPRERLTRAEIIALAVP
jgi:hypothetical protein